MLLAAALAAGAAMMMPAVANAAMDGTWIVDGGGSWNVGTNWQDGNIADGSGATATISRDVPTTGATITLDAPRTIGNLIFGDTDTSTAGSWTLNAGTGSPALTLAGTTPTITVNPMGSGKFAQIGAVISGSQGLTKSGTGTLVLSGTDDYSGGTNITQGRLRAASNSALGSGTVTVTAGAGLELNGNISLSNTLNLNGTSAIVLNASNNTLSGTINVQTDSRIGSSAGANTLTLSGTLSGSANLELFNLGSTTTITNDNSATFSGRIWAERITVALGNGKALGTGTFLLGVNDQGSGIRSTDTTARTIANAFAIIGSANSTYNFGSSTGSVNGDLTFTNGTAMDLAGNNSSIAKFQVYNRTQFDAGFTGSGKGITMQTGAGTLVINGNSDYTGATTVNAGTMLINGTKSGAGAVNVNSAGTLGGIGTISGATTVTGGTLAPGQSPGTLTFTGNVSLDANSILGFDLDATDQAVGGGVNDLIVLNSAGSTLTLDGTLNVTSAPLGPGTWRLLNYSGSLVDNGLSIGTLSLAPDTSAEIVTGGGQVNLVVSGTAVPEPASLGVLALGGLALLARRRRSPR
jgi:autotransporter-associated beta strand protein